MMIIIRVDSILWFWSYMFIDGYDNFIICSKKLIVGLVGEVVVRCVKIIWWKIIVIVIKNKWSGVIKDFLYFFG